MGAGSVRPSGTPKFCEQVAVCKTIVDRGDGVLLPLLLVVGKVPGTMRNDGASEAPAELLENIDGARKAVLLVDGIVGSCAGVAGVVKPAAVNRVAA